MKVSRWAVGLAIVVIPVVCALALPFLYVFLLDWGDFQQARESRAQCHEVDSDVVVARIEANLTIPGGGTLQDARLTVAKTNPRVGFLSAEVQGAGYEGDADLVVWSIEKQGDPTTDTFEASDPIYAENGLAGQVSTFPFSGKSLSSYC
jgi:hypothetical protein